MFAMANSLVQIRVDEQYIQRDNKACFLVRFFRGHGIYRGGVVSFT